VKTTNFLKWPIFFRVGSLVNFYIVYDVHGVLAMLRPAGSIRVIQRWPAGRSVFLSMTNKKCWSIRIFIIVSWDKLFIFDSCNFNCGWLSCRHFECFAVSIFMVKFLAVALAVVFIVQWSHILSWVMLQRQHINLKSLISGDYPWKAHESPIRCMLLWICPIICMHIIHSACCVTKILYNFMCN